MSFVGLLNHNSLIWNELKGLIIFGQNLDLPAIVVHSRGVRHGRSEDHGGACVAAASDDCISNQNVLATEHTASLRAAEINLTGFFSFFL